MSCLPCFTSQKSNREHDKGVADRGRKALLLHGHDKRKRSAEPKNKKDEANKVENGNIAAQTFTFRELATATKNFRPECLLGEGGFGRVYKGKLQKSGQVVAVKQLDRNGLQGNKEFLVEVLMLSLLHHQNLVNLVGYCADGDQRLLVYEFLSGGSLEDHLLDNGLDRKPLDWYTRMKIASGAAKGLEYLHDKANPPVIYRDLKSSNILLDEDLNPKLSDFGLAKLGADGDKIHVSSRVMGTYGYCAPEYARKGELTVKSDVFSFGVVLLELITGRRAIDNTRPTEEQNLVTWAQPVFREPKRFPDIADPLLNGQFPERGLNQAVAIAAMCLQEEASVRPLISDVVTALSFLSVPPNQVVSTPPVGTHPEQKIPKEGEDNHDHERIEDKEACNVQRDEHERHDHNDEDSSVTEEGDSAKHQHGDGSDHEDVDSANADSSDHEDVDSANGDSSDHDDGDSANGSSSDHEDGDSAKHQDGETLDHEDRYSAEHRDVYSSDFEDEDSAKDEDENNSYSEEGDSEYYDGDESDEEHQQAVTKVKERSLSSRYNSSRASQDGINSLRRMSSGRSRDGSISLSQKSSSQSMDGSLSLSRESSKGSQDGSISLSHESVKGSQDRNISLSREGSKGSQDRIVLLTCTGSQRSQDGSVSLKSTGGQRSQVGSISLTRKGSQRSQDGSISLTRKGSQRSQDGSVSLTHTGSQISQDGSVSLSRRGSRESHDEGVSLSRENSRV